MRYLRYLDVRKNIVRSSHSNLNVFCESVVISAFRLSTQPVPSVLLPSCKSQVFAEIVR